MAFGREGTADFRAAHEVSEVTKSGAWQQEECVLLPLWAQELLVARVCRFTLLFTLFSNPLNPKGVVAEATATRTDVSHHHVFQYAHSEKYVGFYFNWWHHVWSHVIGLSMTSGFQEEVFF